VIVSTRTVDEATAIEALTAAASQTATMNPSSIPDDDEIDPLREEEIFDQQFRHLVPGCEDSEDEYEDTFEADNLDRMAFEEDNLAAIQEADYVESSTTSRPIWGCPVGWKQPAAPEGWTPPAADTAHGEPEFDNVDNPGNWSSFTFRPKFKKTKGGQKEYLYHALPTGATAVPINPATGDRTIGDWTFFYKGWDRDFDDEAENMHHLLHGLPTFRDGALRGSMMFPCARKGRLSPEILTSLGCNSGRMKDKDGFPDALFFYQLLFPICDTSMNDNDPRMSFYSEVARFSNTYASAELGLGFGYYHAFRQVLIPEFLRWDGVVVQDGVRGGSNGAII
jgi:hypothetical protein